MKVKELIGMLQTANPEADAKAYDADAGEDMLITGMVYNSEAVTLHTDDIS